MLCKIIELFKQELLFLFLFLDRLDVHQETIVVYTPNTDEHGHVHSEVRTFPS